MDEAGFRKALQKKGKKPHVVDGLVHAVALFEDYLAEGGKTLNKASRKDIFDYAAVCEQEKKDSARIKIRGVALYYKFTGNTEMGSTAASIREKGTVKYRKGFLLKDFRGVNQDYAAKLKASGIADVNHMLKAGRTPQSREQLAFKTGIPLEAIVEFTKLSDLARVQGIKTIRARLYYDAGIDCLEKMARQDSTEMRLMLAEFVRKTGFDGVPPTPGEAKFSIDAAKKLPRVVEW